jgi:hypothetical protein
MLYAPLQLSKEQLLDRVSCFGMFRKSYRKRMAMEETKNILKQRFHQGKQLGQQVNQARNRINYLKNLVTILKIRINFSR